MWRALSRLADRYASPRLLSLHPATQRQAAAEGGQDCITCFTARTDGNTQHHGGRRKQGGASRAEAGDKKRGFALDDGAVFQYDGNMGYVAAVAEALVQSHVPGHVVLLPALPGPMAAVGGAVRGLRARGDVDVSVAWYERRHANASASAAAAGGGSGGAAGVAAAWLTALSGAPPGKAKAPAGDKGDGAGTVGGRGYVYTATLVFHAPHPWYAPLPASAPSAPAPAPAPAPAAAPPVPARHVMVEDAAGFFSWPTSFPTPPPKAAPGAAAAVSEVVVVYPHGRRPLRLHPSSTLPPRAPGACARVRPGGAVIAGESLPAAANPEQFLDSNDGDRGGGGGGGGGGAGAGGKARGEKKTRRGIAIPRFDFPCKIVLRP